MSGWKRELVEAVDEVLRLPNLGGKGEWRCLGKAVRTTDDGWYAVDLRSGARIPPSADSFDKLCFADAAGPERGSSLPVERSRMTDGVLWVEVAGVLPKGCDQLWTIRFSPRHLWQKLRDGVAAAKQTPLADRLADGQLDPIPERRDEYPPGFLPSQRGAYRACVEPGLHMVWGPPGTGKTRVLARAIEDLVRRDMRVLLVSTANIAVDNALNEVVRHLRPSPGTVIRVGAPYLSDLAHNDDVLLDRLAARASADAEADRRRVVDELERLGTLSRKLQNLDRALVGFDREAYQQALERVDAVALLSARRSEWRKAQAASEQARTELRAAAVAARELRAKSDELAEPRATLARVKQLEASLDQLEQQLARSRAEALQVEALACAADHGSLYRFQVQRELKRANARLDQTERQVATDRVTIEEQIAWCRAMAHPVTEEDLADIDRLLAAASRRYEAAEDRAALAAEHAQTLRREWGRLERTEPTQADHDMVAAAKAKRLPEQYGQRELLRAQRPDLERATARAEDQLRELDKRITTLRRDAEGEIVDQAKVVATTLARSRAHPAVARQRFDVVLVDEAGAAVLGEVLFAVALATRTATLLGDFLQLGPVLGEVEKAKAPQAVRWLHTDAFTHCGIRRPADAEDKPGCVSLIYQFRFGPNLRRLANDVVYGVLADGHTEVSGRVPADTEIILIDVNGLDDLHSIHLSSKYAGWWAVGALLSRTLAEYHSGDDGGIGIVTPYREQVQATHAALRDSGQNLSVAVGTAHSFQGREFDTVVFDLVDGGNGWVSNASWNGTNFERDGVRLFGVGITRARKRLYVIADGLRAVKTAKGDSPLGALRRLDSDQLVQWCRASMLLGMAESVGCSPVSAVEDELSQVLSGLVDITDVHDEYSFDNALDRHLAEVRDSLWMWSPWVARKSQRFLPAIAEAVARGVEVRVFVRNERSIQPNLEWWIAKLKTTGATVIRADVEHRKIVILDRKTVILGSQNPLSQHRSREAMITCRGAAFAERMLTELKAEPHGFPPTCHGCRQDFELRRSGDWRKNRSFYWWCDRCKIKHETSRPHRTSGTARTEAIDRRG